MIRHLCAELTVPAAVYFATYLAVGPWPAQLRTLISGGRRPKGGAR